MSSVSPTPWKYCSSENGWTGKKDWIEDANGETVVFDVGHIDGPKIVEARNVFERLTEGERLLRRLVDIGKTGFITCNSAPGEHPTVTASFGNLTTAQAFHSLFAYIADHVSALAEESEVQDAE